MRVTAMNAFSLIIAAAITIALPSYVFAVPDDWINPGGGTTTGSSGGSASKGIKDCWEGTGACSGGDSNKDKLEKDKKESKLLKDRILMQDQTISNALKALKEAKKSGNKDKIEAAKIQLKQDNADLSRLDSKFKEVQRRINHLEHHSEHGHKGK